MTFHMIALCIALYLLTLRTALVLRYLQIILYVCTYCSVYGEDAACQCTSTCMPFLLLNRVHALYPSSHHNPVPYWYYLACIIDTMFTNCETTSSASCPKSYSVLLITAMPYTGPVTRNSQADLTSNCFWISFLVFTRQSCQHYSPKRSCCQRSRRDIFQRAIGLCHKPVLLFSYDPYDPYTSIYSATCSRWNSRSSHSSIYRSF